MSTNRDTLPKRRTLLLRAMLFILLFLGGLLFAGGLVDHVVRPHTQLDAILSQEELADRAKKEAVLEILRRLAANQRSTALAISACGAVIFMASAVGLVALESGKSIRKVEP